MLPKHDHQTADEVLEKIVGVTRQYLTGALIVMAILSVLNSVGLIALGVKSAIFFGILAAVLNIIPYVGVWIGTLLPVMMALITKDSVYSPLLVIGLFMVTQFIDNNFLTPRITGSQVRLNALAAIGGIIVGNLVWGVAGMILFIPLLGIMKIIFDNVEELKPFGYLIGDNGSEREFGIVRSLKRARDKKKAAAANP